MALSPGTRLGPYEILSALGAGGMGEVYKARDTRLARSVAIKVLPPDTAADAAARARFEREARAIAALSHPHICVVHDVGHHEGTDYLVMELLDGETLGERLARAKGPLPLDEVLKIGVAIADALDKAHRAGIVHRDLKPANVMLTKSGPKLLDFGLAKLHEVSPVALSDGTAATTMAPGTAHGTILGTIHYMAPEQVEGRAADARCDIWALGAVLYEMATGTRPFDGDSAASIVGAIMQGTPVPLATRQPLTPPAFEHVVERCLEKDADERWQNVGDVQRQLRWIASGPVRGLRAGDSPPLDRPANRWRVAALLASVAAALVVGGVATRMTMPPPATAPERAFQFHLEPPPGKALLAGAQGGAAVSPDGRLVVFVGSSGGSKLWLRNLESIEARELPGTAGAAYPFWSPDSRRVGFFAEGKLKTADVAGGSPVSVADAVGARGGSWGPDDTLLFAPPAGPILKVPRNGGASPEPVTVLDAENGESMHRWPQLLPDGRHLLYYVRSSQAHRGGIYLGTLGQPDRKTFVVESSARGAYAPSRGKGGGHLLWVRGVTLMAQDFDPETGRLSGEPVFIPGAGRVGNIGALSQGQVPFWVSQEGTLVFSDADDLYPLEWVNREGKPLGTIGSGRYAAVALGPGERQAAVSVTDDEGNRDIWKMELDRTLLARVTHTTGNVPVWSPDGQRIAYHDSTTTNIFTAAVDGTSPPEEIHHSNAVAYINDWTPDGRYLVYTETSPKTANDLWLAPVDGTHTPVPLLVTPFGESHGHFSPDGKWLAYTSDESGRDEVYVRSLVGRGSTRVSTGGGSFSRWRRDGRELFYRAPDGMLNAVSFDSVGERVVLGTAIGLFHVLEPLGTFAYPFDVSADGQRFLTLGVSDREKAPLTVIVNWEATLNR